MWRLLLLAGWAAAQSNYADHANSIEFPNEGLPDSTVLDGKVTKLDDLAPVIFLNRTKAALNCAAGYMQVTSYFDLTVLPTSSRAFILYGFLIERNILKCFVIVFIYKIQYNFNGNSINKRDCT